MSEQKKSLLERIMGSAKKKTENNNGKLEAQVKEKLKAIVYDDEIVEELTPSFMKFYGQEGFEQVLELLESKEQQIEYIAGGDWFKQESNPEEKKEEEDEQDSDALSYVDELLKQKYSKENS